MGTLVKRLLSTKLGCSDAALSRLFHVTVMPCYDKKLEASREELTVAEGRVPEVIAMISKSTRTYNDHVNPPHKCSVLLQSHQSTHLSLSVSSVLSVLAIGR
jgi:hypothetical protein